MAIKHSRTALVAVFILYVLVLFAPDILLWFEFDREFNSSHSPFQVGALSLVLFGLLNAILGRPHVVVWLMLPFALLVPVELYYIVRFHTPSTSHILAVIADTNWEEASGYIRGQAGLLLLAFTANLVMCCAICALMTRWRKFMHFPGDQRGMLLAVCLVGLQIMVMVRDTKGDTEDLVEESRQFQQQKQEAPNKVLLAIDQLHVEAGYPFGVVLRVYRFLNQQYENAHSEDSLASFHFNARQATNVKGKQVYILVIGETGRRDRWQLNGYSRSTNPHLSLEQNLVDFHDMISVATLTRISVPFMVSPRQISDQELRQKSVVSAFREAGFSTYWMSTQDPQAAIGAMYSNEAEHRTFFNPTEWRFRGSYDSAMLEPLARVLAKPEQRQFIVLHTEGSHFDYASRYPASFAAFRPSPPPASVSPYDAGFSELLNNSYDNSVLFSDYFLSQVIQTVKATGAVSLMVYAADHGEDILGGGCLQAGHGFLDKTNFDIASFAWYSDTYGVAFPQKVTNLRRHAALPLTVQNIFPTLLDAAGITASALDVSRSIVSDALTYHRRLVLRVPVLNYDEAKFVGSCKTIEARDVIDPPDVSVIYPPKVMP